MVKIKAIFLNSFAHAQFVLNIKIHVVLRDIVRKFLIANVDQTCTRSNSPGI